MSFKNIKCAVLGCGLLFTSSGNLIAQATGYGEKVAATALKIWGDSLNINNTSELASRRGKGAHWTYERGVLTNGFEALWYKTGDPKYYETIRTAMEVHFDKEGNFNAFKIEDYNLDNILTGRALITLYKVTGNKKYLRAIEYIKQQLSEQPKTKEGGYWHKLRYPYQMWMDGLYMAEGFSTELAALKGDKKYFDEVVNQFVLMEKNARDPKTGLLYHGYDESRQEQWANKETGLSQHFWSRAVGWYVMGIVDALDYIPKDYEKRQVLIDILTRTLDAVIKVQDDKTGTWWNLLNLPNYKENYLESSGTTMFVYAMAKGVRNGYLNESYLIPAKKGYKGLVDKFISKDAEGNYHFEGTVSVSGLGGKPYRDGSFEYYMSEKVVQDDPKGLGAFIKTAVEMDIIETTQLGKGKNVVLDYYFNNEFKKDAFGNNTQWHYTWDEKDNNGFSLLGSVFTKHGVDTLTLKTAPTAENLKNADIYIIVDPDGLKDNKNPNYITEASAQAIYDWVNNGGVLVLMTNDSANCDLQHTNILANKFGINFSNQGRNFVKGNDYATGAVAIKKNEIFKNTKKIYVKEISIIEAKKPAKALVKADNGDVVIATAKVGKGSVFAIGDPWLYNEYTDGRKIPAEYQNFEAANELVKWVIKKSAVKK